MWSSKTVSDRARKKPQSGKVGEHVRERHEALPETPLWIRGTNLSAVSHRHSANAPFSPPLIKQPGVAELLITSCSFIIRSA